MDFGRIWFEVKKKAKRIFKKIKRFFRKLIRWFRRYIRLLIRHTKARDYSVLIYTIVAVIAIVLVFCFIWKAFFINRWQKEEAACFNYGGKYSS